MWPRQEIKFGNEKLHVQGKDVQKQGGTVCLPQDHVQVVPLWDCASTINENLYP